MLPQTQNYIACPRVKKRKGFNNNKGTYDMNALEAMVTGRPYLLFTRTWEVFVREDDKSKVLEINFLLKSLRYFLCKAL